jgi:hypothetical protein
MQLDLDHSFNKNVITPYTQGDRRYHLLFLRTAEGPFFVRSTTYKIDTLITIGEIYTKLDSTKNRVVGNIFYTGTNSQCEGTYLLAYSGLFHQQAQKKIPTDFNMELVLKERGFQMFSQRNRATLIISPALKLSIKANLEI